MSGRAWPDAGRDFSRRAKVSLPQRVGYESGRVSASVSGSTVLFRYEALQVTGLSGDGLSGDALMVRALSDGTAPVDGSAVGRGERSAQRSRCDRATCPQDYEKQKRLPKKDSCRGDRVGHRFAAKALGNAARKAEWTIQFDRTRRNDPCKTPGRGGTRPRTATTTRRCVDRRPDAEKPTKLTEVFRQTCVSSLVQLTMKSKASPRQVDETLLKKNYRSMSQRKLSHALAGAIGGLI